MFLTGDSLTHIPGRVSVTAASVFLIEVNVCHTAESVCPTAESVFYIFSNISFLS